MEMSSPATSRRAGVRGTGWGRGECTVVVAPPDFPPSKGRHEEWRATIRSLITVDNKAEPRPMEPPGRRSNGVPHTSGRKAGGAATTVHSPPPRPVPRTPARRDITGDEISIAASDPRTHCDQRQVLREREHEDARTTIERRRGARHQSDRRAGPAVNHPAPESPGGLPYEVGCPAFTRELRQF